MVQPPSSRATSALEPPSGIGTSPFDPWRRHCSGIVSLDALRDIMKDLGNEAIHTNDGDVARQSHLDADLLVRVGELFTLLLIVIYEAPQRRADLKRRSATSWAR